MTMWFPHFFGKIDGTCFFFFFMALPGVVLKLPQARLPVQSPELFALVWEPSG